VRAVLDGETVLDSTRAKMLHRHAQLARYFFPRDDWRWDLLDGLEPVLPPPGVPDLADHAVVGVDRVPDDPVVLLEPGSHVAPRERDVDVRDSSRHVRVALDGEVLGESTRTRVIFETGLPSRWYFPPEDTRVVDYVAFFDERVDVDIDGERQLRPRTPWAAPGWWRLPAPDV
jgi:uncharacterized protein (DUF427 family)